MRYIHKGLFVLIMAVMLISPVAKVLENYTESTLVPLKGHINYAEFPVFSWDSWFTGTYQKDYSNYLEDHIGFRNIFVRSYNQFNWSLFRKPANKGIIPGDNDFLYTINYIDAYYGRTFIGYDKIRNHCEMIKEVQVKLDSLGIVLFIVLAPGKASMFPENIPERYSLAASAPTNNQAYLECFREYGIRHIDFHTHFKAIRDTSTYPLYHKAGIHWNTYGAYYALDSIVRYLENESGLDMADMYYEGIEWAEQPRGSDYDVGDALNIFSRIHDQPMPYPYGYKYRNVDKARPNLMVIGDSYYWTIFNLEGNHRLWNKHDFRYYDVQMVPAGGGDKTLRDLSYEEFVKYDFVMVLYTESNMHVLANKFFEKSYAVLTEPIEIENIKKRILNDDKWLASIKEKADRKGISLDEQLHLDAMWIFLKESN